MPPPGGAGGASVGYIKEKPDPWEVRDQMFSKLSQINYIKMDTLKPDTNTTTPASDVQEKLSQTGHNNPMP